jgi:pyridoxal phosphate-dependent aminotransferase EpsN
LSCFLIEEQSFGASRDEVIRTLDEANIEARPLWKPMHLQRLYRNAECYGGSVAEDLFRRGICLPSSTNLAEQEQELVINVVRKAAQASTFSFLNTTA